MLWQTGLTGLCHLLVGSGPAEMDGASGHPGPLLPRLGHRGRGPGALPCTQPVESEAQLALRSLSWDGPWSLGAPCSLPAQPTFRSPTAQSRGRGAAESGLGRPLPCSEGGAR